uniref:Alternative protein LPAR2 n=1 Tax=Homo sapiens TaxID=9606 RepID=L8E990_HUMAN|nr:alternative protein LPAR2 [Homo sapiens]
MLLCTLAEMLRCAAPSAAFSAARASASPPASLSTIHPLPREVPALASCFPRTATH